MLKMPWSKPKMEPSGLMFWIEPMKTRHLDAVCEIESKSFADPWPPLAFLTAIEDRNTSKAVASVDGEVIGYCVIERGPVSSQIVNLAVAAPFRRTRMASAMIAQQSHLLAMQSRISLLAAVSDKNLDAQKFFRAVGFEAISIGTRFFHNGDDAYIFQFRSGAMRKFRELQSLSFALPNHDAKDGKPVPR